MRISISLDLPNKTTYDDLADIIAQAVKDLAVAHGSACLVPSQVTDIVINNERIGLIGISKK